MKSFSAETVKLRYLQSIYFDEKGGGIEATGGCCLQRKISFDCGRYGKRSSSPVYLSGQKHLKAGNEIKIPQLSNPIRVQMNSKGEIFALDGKKRRIVRLSPTGAFKGYVDPEGIPIPFSFCSKEL